MIAVGARYAVGGASRRRADEAGFCEARDDEVKDRTSIPEKEERRRGRCEGA